MSKALATLPWVESGTIEANRSTRMVEFGINSKSSYSEDSLRNVLPSRYRKDMEVVEAPH